MPTPEALALLHRARTIDGSRFVYNDEEIAGELDRFAAQRGAAESVSQESLLTAPQTGGGDAPDMSMDAIRARLATHQPLGSHAKGVAGLAIAPDELTERDGGDPTQTGGGDAPRRHLTQDEVRIMDKALLASSTLIHAGELTGGGDAGERAREDEDDVRRGGPEYFRAALQESRREGQREGAEAMREALRGACDDKPNWSREMRVAADIIRGRMKATADIFLARMGALPIPGKTDAG